MNKGTNWVYRYNTKPNFSVEQVDSILRVFQAELALAGQQLTTQSREALTVYIRAKKNFYENRLFEGVLEGDYLCSVAKKTEEVVFKVAPATLSEASTAEDRQALLEKRSDLLNTALNVMRLHGKRINLYPKPKNVVNKILEGAIVSVSQH